MPEEQEPKAYTSLVMPDVLDNAHKEVGALRTLWSVNLPGPEGKTDPDPDVPNILFCPSSRYAVAHYRMWIPAVYTAQAGLANCRVTNGLQVDDLSWADIIVVNRLDTDPRCIHKLYNWTRMLGKRIVYDVDDNLHAIPRTNNVKEELIRESAGNGLGDQYIGTTPELESIVRRAGADYKGKIRALLELATLVTVSTPELASFYCKYNSNIQIVGNYLDFRNPAWDIPRVKKDYLVIGFAGSASHHPDLMEIKPAIERIVKDYDHVKFAVCGVREWGRLFDLPRDKYIFINPVDLIDYPRIWSFVDVSLAPLTTYDFNKYKTALKLKDAGACGVPSVASALNPYTRFQEKGREFTDGTDVVYLASRLRDWEDGMRRMIEDSKYRTKMGERVKSFVREEYNAANHASVWMQAYITGLSKPQEDKS